MASKRRKKPESIPSERRMVLRSETRASSKGSADVPENTPQERTPLGPKSTQGSQSREKDKDGGVQKEEVRSSAAGKVRVSLFF